LEKRLRNLSACVAMGVLVGCAHTAMYVPAPQQSQEAYLKKTDKASEAGYHALALSNALEAAHKNNGLAKTPAFKEKLAWLLLENKGAEPAKLYFLGIPEATRKPNDWLGLGIASYQLGDYDLAIKSLDRAQPGLKEKKLANALFLKGQSYAALGKRQKALEQYEAAGTVYPLLSGLEKAINDLYREDTTTEEKKIVPYAPTAVQGKPDTVAYKKITTTKKSKEFDESAKDRLVCIGSHPNASLRTIYGSDKLLQYQRSGNYADLDQALVNLGQAMLDDPNFALAYYWAAKANDARSQFLEQSGDIDKAKEIHKRANVRMNQASQVSSSVKDLEGALNKCRGKACADYEAVSKKYHAEKFSARFLQDKAYRQSAIESADKTIQLLKQEGR
jgi:hypothetical protein